MNPNHICLHGEIVRFDAGWSPSDNVIQMTKEDVSLWLEERSLGHLTSTFLAQNIDGEVFLGLTRADLKEMQLPICDRIRFFNRALKFLHPNFDSERLRFILPNPKKRSRESI